MTLFELLEWEFLLHLTHSFIYCEIAGLRLLNLPLGVMSEILEIQVYFTKYLG